MAILHKNMIHIMLKTHKDTNELIEGIDFAVSIYYSSDMSSYFALAVNRFTNNFIGYF